MPAETLRLGDLQVQGTEVPVGSFFIDILARDVEGRIDERHYVATDKMHLIGRMHGRGWYARTTDLFEMDRISYAEWRDGRRR